MVESPTLPAPTPPTNLSLTFNNVELTPIFQDGKIWVTSGDLSKALGYSREDEVPRLYRRHADEFSEEMTMLLNLSDGKPPKINVNTTLVEPITPNLARCFSPRGCHLLAMLARTNVAKTFRRWVLDVLEHYTADHSSQVPAQAPIPVTQKYLTEDQCATIQALVKATVQKLPENQRDNRACMAVWIMLKNHFHVTTYRKLTHDRYHEALTFISQINTEDIRKNPPFGYYQPKQGDYPPPPIDVPPLAGKAKKGRKSSRKTKKSK